MSLIRKSHGHFRLLGDTVAVYMDEDHVTTIYEIVEKPFNGGCQYAIVSRASPSTSIAVFNDMVSAVHGLRSMVSGQGITLSRNGLSVIAAGVLFLAGIGIGIMHEQKTQASLFHGNVAMPHMSMPLPDDEPDINALMPALQKKMAARNTPAPAAQTHGPASSDGGAALPANLSQFPPDQQKRILDMKHKTDVIINAIRKRQKITDEMLQGIPDKEADQIRDIASQVGLYGSDGLGHHGHDKPVDTKNTKDAPEAKPAPAPKDSHADPAPIIDDGMKIPLGQTAPQSSDLSTGFTDSGTLLVPPVSTDYSSYGQLAKDYPVLTGDKK